MSEGSGGIGAALQHIPVNTTSEAADSLLSGKIFSLPHLSPAGAYSGVQEADRQDLTGRRVCFVFGASLRLQGQAAGQMRFCWSLAFC